MQTYFIRLGLGLGFMALCLTVKSQAFEATYTYDANGNRLTATVIYLQTYLKSGQIPINQITKDSVVLGDSNIPAQGWAPPIIEPMDELKIKVYPNPTHGILLLEISGINKTLSSSPDNKLEVFNIRGQLVLQISPLNNYNSINFSTFGNGIYLIKLLIDGLEKDYKIIKE